MVICFIMHSKYEYDFRVWLSGFHHYYLPLDLEKHMYCASPARVYRVEDMFESCFRILHLYDVVNTPGVTADVSHIDTGAVTPNRSGRAPFDHTDSSCWLQVELGSKAGALKQMLVVFSASYLA
ncbi:peroxisomal NAD-malate dehydrogenase [Trifolium repens]|nr:peroxisomal NAD-malate dehydrogenase [Trifolium repens]